VNNEEGCSRFLASDRSPMSATESQAWLQEAIAAVKSGESEKARGLLLRVIETDESEVCQHEAYDFTQWLPQTRRFVRRGRHAVRLTEAEHTRGLTSPGDGPSAPSPGALLMSDSGAGQIGADHAIRPGLLITPLRPH
jgi:hypothetical protein